MTEPITQAALDQEMQESTRSKHRKRDKHKQDKGAGSTTSYGQKLIGGAVGPVIKELDRLKTDSSEPGFRAGGLKCLREVDSGVCALLTIQCTLDSLSDRPTFNSLATRIGRLLDQERRFGLMAQDPDHRPLWKWLHKNTKSTTSDNRRRRIITAAAKRLGAYADPWPHDDSFRAGALMLAILRSETGLVEFKRNSPRQKVGRAKYPRFVEATPETLEWIENAKVSDAFLEPVKLPLVVPPYRWTSARAGGYFADSTWGGLLIKTNSKDALDTNTPLSCPRFFSAVNYLQSVPYLINQRVLEMMLHCRDRSLEVGGLPSPDNEPLPTRELDMDDLEARRRWRRRARLVHEQNVRSQSLRIHVAKLGYLANRLQDSTIFFVHTADFRQRLYTESSGFLQPQGNDWARSLLSYGFGKTLNDDGVRELAITGANLFGIGGSFDERLQWVSDNDAEIRRIEADPMQHRDLWTTADKPWQALAWSMEWGQLQRQGKKFESRLVCHRDATCNGLQVFSMLLRDEAAARTVNLVECDQPADAYSDVAAVTLDLMRQESDPDLIPFAQGWIRYGVPRAATKRPLMILPYNGSLFSARNYIEEWYQETRRGAKTRKVHDDERAALNYLAVQVWAAIDLQLTKAREAMNWFADCADVCTDAGFPVRWHTPTNFLAAQNYKNMQPYTIKTMLGRKAICWHSLQRELPQIHKRKSRQALSPNFIHSVDASGLVFTANKMQLAGVDCMTAVHDSYGTLAADVCLMSRLLREAWQEMMEQPIMENFKNELEQDTGLSLPALPERGGLDLDLAKANYFFN